MNKATTTKTEVMKCSCCGKVDKTVSDRICGYVQDVHDEEIWERVCDDCEYEHILEI